MASIDRATLDEAARGPHKGGVLAALGGPQFIVAQLFTIFATILGVYLAGYVGFQRTLEYDRFVKANEQANLLRAMHAELKDNATRLREFVPRMEKTQEGHGIYGDWPRLHLFIWRASAQNQSLFTVPPQTLADMQGFYEEIEQMLNDATARSEFRSLTTSNTYSRKVFTEQFDAKIKVAETRLLPSLETAAASAEALVKDYEDVGQ
ncbi:MAG: hypothetical protein HC850_02800 [Rhodomicrobium sp.]|nr:hypothetical protein [Rhodomicrobium sp.]